MFSLKTREFGLAGEWVLLLLILLTAAALRFWGAYFDLPYIYHPDEPVNIGIVQGMLATGDLNPHAFYYPSLFYYLNALGAAIYFGGAAWISGSSLHLADRSVLLWVQRTPLMRMPLLFIAR